MINCRIQKLKTKYYIIIFQIKFIKYYFNYNFSKFVCQIKIINYILQSYVQLEKNYEGINYFLSEVIMMI